MTGRLDKLWQTDGISEIEAGIIFVVQSNIHRRAHDEARQR